MSIWGRRVDDWVNQRIGNPTRADYNRAGLAAFWQVALVVLAAVALLAAFNYVR